MHVSLYLGNHGYIWQVLPVYEFLKMHFKTALTTAPQSHTVPYKPRHPSDDPFDDIHPQFTVNILNAQMKFQKYADKPTSPIYVATVLLVPWMRGLSIDNV